MTVTRRGLADEIDRLDEHLAEINSEKAAMYAAYREQLEHDGTAKAEIKAELQALKAAIRKRRALAKDRRTVEDADYLLDEIINEITGGPSRSRAREEQEPVRAAAE